MTANGVDFTYLACGRGPLALCLHGFPDSAHTWRGLLPQLAAAGFRAVAPFLRWYFFFQHPLSDVIVPLDDLAFIDRLWADWSPGYDGAADVAFAKEALRQPADLQAALGYYRAALRTGYRDPDLEEIDAKTSQPVPIPLFYGHGADDGCIGAELASGLHDDGCWRRAPRWPCSRERVTSSTSRPPT